MNKNNSQLSHFFILITLFAIAAVLYLPLLDANHVWWGDFALYLSHARNIVEGLPYADTGYVVNPAMSWLSPPAYPPVFSYLLAPVYKLFGLNLLAPKIFLFAIFVILTGLFYWYATQHLETRTAGAGASLALVLSPWFWEMKNLILSDIPFVLFTFASILIADKVSRLTPRNKGYWLWALLLGIMFYLAYGTRSLGISLPAALLLFDLVKFRRIRLSTIIALAVFISCYILQNLLLDIDKSYATAMVSHAMRDQDAGAPDLFERGIHFAQYLFSNLIDRSEDYAWTTQAYWDNSVSLILRLVMAGVTGLLMLVGFVASARRNLSFAEVFMVAYLGLLLIVPFVQGYRYLLPLVPFFLFYIFLGAETTLRWTHHRHAKLLPAAVGLAIILSHLGFYSTQLAQPPANGVNDAAAIELYTFIEESVSRDELIVHDKPRILALFTGRQTTVFLPDHTLEELWQHFESTNAAFLVFNIRQPHKDFENYDSVMQHSQDRLKLVFENTDFRVYRILR